MRKVDPGVFLGPVSERIRPDIASDVRSRA